jgi:hypothetical protein
MSIKSGSVVELMDLGPEPIDPRYAAYFPGYEAHGYVLRPGYWGDRTKLSWTSSK